LRSQVGCALRTISMSDIRLRCAVRTLHGFDESTNILTIPTVVVGNKTFSNVVVKLNNYNVLSYTPYPAFGLVSSGILWNFNGCYHQATQLVCNLTLTSQNQDRTVYFETGIYLYDDRGNGYGFTTLKIANNSTGRSISQTFIANVQTPMQITFDGIASNATAISKLSIFGSVNGNSTGGTITNSPFINSAPPNPF
jgi:hypothetical protein